MYSVNFRLGIRHLMAQMTSEAEDYFRAEPRDSSCYVEAQGNLGFVLVLQRKCSEAAEVLQRIEQRIDSECNDLGSRVQFRRNHAEALVGLGRAAESIPYFQRAFETADALAASHREQRATLMQQKAHAKNSAATAYLALDRSRDNLERAKSHLLEARELYRQFPDELFVGYAECLTSLSETYRLLDNKLEADLAIHEALQILQQTGDREQTFRVMHAAIRLGSNVIPRAMQNQILLDGILVAEEESRWNIAYLRCVIGAQIASADGDCVFGLECVTRGRLLESMIDGLTFECAALRNSQAQLLSNDSRGQDVIKILVEGCHYWYNFIAHEFSIHDFQVQAGRLHEHFRRTSAALIDGQRFEEAFFVLEAGRALLHAAQVDPTFLQRTVSINPFQVDGQINRACLAPSMQSLLPGSCAIAFGIFPRRIVAFVLNSEHVHCVTENISSDDRGSILQREAIELRLRLEHNGGENTIPAELRSLANKIAKLVGDQVVCSLIPHSWLHDIPWRSLLRVQGLSWEQLQCSSGYAFLLRTQNRLSHIDCNTIIALGHGTVGDGDTMAQLQDEAEEFASFYEGRGQFRSHATAVDVEMSLSTADVVFISCHGRARGDDLSLELSENGGNSSTTSTVGDLILQNIKAQLVILSACESGVYSVEDGDFPVGGVPRLLRAGVRYCIASRYKIRVQFTKRFFSILRQHLRPSTPIAEAFAATLAEVEVYPEVDFWRDLACIDLFGDP